MRLVLGYLAVLWGQDNLAGSINEVSRLYMYILTYVHPFSSTHELLESLW